MGRQISPQTRDLVDPQTGERVQVQSRFRRPDEQFAMAGRYTVVSDELVLDLLHRASGFGPTDRDVLALVLHGAQGNPHQLKGRRPRKPRDSVPSVLRWTREEMAEYLGRKPRTIGSSLRKLEAAGLIIVGETHGSLKYYRASPHYGSHEGGQVQRQEAQSFPKPLVPQAPEELAS